MAVALQKEPDLWQSWITDRDQDVFLSVDARRIIGILWSVQSPTLQIVAAAVKQPEEYVVALAQQMKESDSVIVREALTYGLSIDAAVELPHSVRWLKCKKCRQFLSAVPCQQCLIKKRQQFACLQEDAAEETADRPQPPKPTKEKPGSYAKMMVMQERFLAGYSIFHEDDIDIAIKPIPHNMRSTKLRRTQYLDAALTTRPDPHRNGTLRSLLPSHGVEGRGASVHGHRVVL